MRGETTSASGPRVALVGGGTGGHVYPALAVADALRRRCPGVQLLFIGGDRLEAREAPRAGLPFRAISVHGLAGRGWWAWKGRLRSLAELTIGLPLFQCLAALRRFSPDVVVGAGGYASGPALLAARLLGLPTLSLETNLTPGFTSRIACRLVSAMALGWEALGPYFATRVRRGARLVVTGVPVRPEVLAPTRQEGAAALGLDPNRRTLLALGGSLGSRRINEAIVGALALLGRRRPELREVQVVHVIGRQWSPEGGIAAAAAPHYRAVTYLERSYGAALAAADLVVCRAGASTVAELAARGLPAVLIPWSGASTNEQVRNVAPLARAGAAVMIPDAELTPERLAGVLEQLLWDEERLVLMARASRLLGKPGAADAVAVLALELAARRRG